MKCWTKCCCCVDINVGVWILTFLELIWSMVLAGIIAVENVDESIFILLPPLRGIIAITMFVTMCNPTATRRKCMFIARVLLANIL